MKSWDIAYRFFNLYNHYDNLSWSHLHMCGFKKDILPKWMCKNKTDLPCFPRQPNTAAAIITLHMEAWSSVDGGSMSYTKCWFGRKALTVSHLEESGLGIICLTKKAVQEPTVWKAMCTCDNIYIYTHISCCQFRWFCKFCTPYLLP